MVAGVESGKEINDFVTAYFSDDDAVWPHAECLANQGGHGDSADSFSVVLPGDELYELGVWEVEFGCVFDANDAFVCG